MSLTEEELEKNWNKTLELMSKLGERSESATTMVETLGERLYLCPASGKPEFHCAFPGGLLDHSLRVLGNALKLNSAFEWNLPKDSLIIASMFHDLGKCGDMDNDYYIPQTDEWRRNKLGEIYTYNKDMQYMTIPDRSIFLCQHFGLKLTLNEMLAIRLNDGFVVEENRQYCLKEPLLAHVIMTADYISTMQEKEKF
jgi:hypothetical protein